MASIANIENIEHIENIGNIESIVISAFYVSLYMSQHDVQMVSVFFRVANEQFTTKYMSLQATVHLVVTGYPTSVFTNPVVCGSGVITANRGGPYSTSSNCEAYDECQIEVDILCRVKVWERDRCASVRGNSVWSAFSSTTASSGSNGYCTATIQQEPHLDLRRARRRWCLTIIVALPATTLPDLSQMDL